MTEVLVNEKDELLFDEEAENNYENFEENQSEVSTVGSDDFIKIEEEIEESVKEEKFDQPIEKLMINEDSKQDNGKSKKTSRLINNDIGQLSDEMESFYETEKTEDDHVNAMYARLRKHKETKEVLWGKVVSILDGNTMFPNYPIYHDQLIVAVMWNETLIYIPEKEYFEPTFKFSPNYDKLIESAKTSYRRKILLNQSNSRIPFVVDSLIKNINKETDAVVLEAFGSRKDAMEILRDVWFTRTKDYPFMNKNLPVIKVGDETYANVLSVSQFNIIIEVFGIETKLDRFSASNEQVEDCREVAKPGDKIKVRVRKFHVNDAKNDFYLQASARLNASPEAMKSIKKGGYYVGKVDYFNSDKNAYTVRLLIGANCVVSKKQVLNTSNLLVGDLVNVYILNVTDHFCFGTAYKIN